MVKAKSYLCWRHASQKYLVWFYLAVFIRCFLVLYFSFWISYHMVECSAVLHILQSFWKVFCKLFKNYPKCQFVPVNKLFHWQNSAIFVQSYVRNVFPLCYQVIYMTLLSLQFNALFEQFMYCLFRNSQKRQAFSFHFWLVPQATNFWFRRVGHTWVLTRGQRCI